MIKFIQSLPQRNEADLSLHSLVAVTNDHYKAPALEQAGIKLINHMEALEIFRDLERSGLEPLQETYNVDLTDSYYLVNGWCKEIEAYRFRNVTPADLDHAIDLVLEDLNEEKKGTN